MLSAKSLLWVYRIRRLWWWKWAQNSWKSAWREIQLNNVELVDLYKEAEANKQIKLPSSAIDHKILFKEKLQRRESKLPVPWILNAGMYNFCWNLGTRSLKGKILEIVHWPSNWFWSANVLLKGLQGLSTNQVNWNKTKAILKYFWHSVGICYVDKVFDSRKPGNSWFTDYRK